MRACRQWVRCGVLRVGPLVGVPIAGPSWAVERPGGSPSPVCHIFTRIEPTGDQYPPGSIHPPTGCPPQGFPWDGRAKAGPGPGGDADEPPRGTAATPTRGDGHLGQGVTPARGSPQVGLAATHTQPRLVRLAHYLQRAFLVMGDSLYIDHAARILRQNLYQNVTCLFAF